MRLDDGIRTMGFRKWYQRELTRSHLSLLVLLLSGIGALVMLELATRQAPMSDRIGSVALLLACAALGAVALRRYLFLLMRAEHAANQASCPDCGEYGRFRVVRQRPLAQEQQLDVCCRKCAREWVISSGT